MSWEPENPIGFTPCGTAFGAIRKPYSAPCRFFADESPEANRINWFIVPDDTPYYLGRTPFWPRVDVPPDEARAGGFEKEGHGRIVRRFRAGDEYAAGIVDHFTGDEDDFAGLSLRSKYFDGDTPLFVPLECVIRVIKPGMRIGGLSMPLIEKPILGLQMDAFAVPIIKRCIAGMRIGGTSRESIASPTCGIAIGGIAAPGLLEKRRCGFAFGGVVVDPVPVVLRAGIAIGGSTAGASLGAESLRAGIAVGGSISGGIVELLRAGIAVGGSTGGSSAYAESLRAGIMIGAQVADESGGIETMIAGLAIGGVAEDAGGGDPPPDPGNSCAEAGLLSPGVEASGFHPLNTLQWYKFPVTEGETYHVSGVRHTGNMQILVFEGEDCATAGVKFLSTNTTDPTCNAAVAGFGGWWFIAIGSNVNSDYTIVADVGECP